jgi:hypothetical protein
MKHRHHGILSIGRKLADGRLVKYRRLTCEEYEAYYSAPQWRFFPNRKLWFLAWKKETKL